MNAVFDSRPHRRAAAAIAVLYVAIQTFQWYVFSKLPETDDAVVSLMQGPLPLNVARAGTMLLSFFGLAYLFLVVCGIASRRRPDLAILACLGFFTFCLLEIQLRSVELFYVFLELPRRYHAATSALEQARVLEAQAAFQAVQYGLYLPLGLSWLIGSVLVFLALGDARVDWLARFAFGLNALRLALRMFDSYVLGPRFDQLYGELYLAMVVLTFVPLAIWLLRRPIRQGQVPDPSSAGAP
jgi:hypothetical protein